MEFLTIQFSFVLLFLILSSCYFNKILVQFDLILGSHFTTL